MVKPKSWSASAVVLALVLTACGAWDPGGDPSAAPSGPSGSTSQAGTTSPDAESPTSEIPSRSPGAGRGRAVTKLLVFVVENKSLDQMRAGMPYTFELAQEYGYATQYQALTHPSLPNYLAIAAGSTFGVTDDGPPSAHPVTGPSVFGQAVGSGRTAKIYAEGMTGDCALGSDDSTGYAVKHNPWTYFVDERALCTRYDVPLTELEADVASGGLPNAGMVIPDLCNDAHDCDLSVADDWMREEVGAVLAGPDFASGHLAVVVTADEDDRSHGNLVLTTVLHPSQHGRVVGAALTHYSLTRLYGQVLGAHPLGAAASAPDMAAAFDLPLSRH